MNIKLNTIPGQALADFIAETFRSIKVNKEMKLEWDWQIYVDGSSTQKKSGVGVVLITPDGATLSSVIRFTFKASNNVVIYEALLVNLRLAKSIDAQKICIFSDAQLVLNQIDGEFQAKEGNIISYLELAKSLLSSFSTYTIEQNSQEMNANVDALARLALGTDLELGRAIRIELLKLSSIE